MLLIEFVFGYIFRYSGSDKKNKYQRVDETIQMTLETRQTSYIFVCY